ncbi:ATP-binding protein [Streptosporangium sp. NPDC051022]|uniref:ATP-binding protein n=1 Tax=Streptosporangium sp. NPDC051022 TaxID=3155752 RepID=UPI003447EBCC
MAACTERIFERFFKGQPIGGNVRPAILKSWRRCQEIGLVPEQLDFADPVEVDTDCALVRVARPVLERFRVAIADTGVSLLLFDEQARMLQRYESDLQLRRALDRMHHFPGVEYTEALLGTNAAGTPLREKRLVQVTGFEHLAECMQLFTATGVPILDPLTGHARGVMTIACLNERAHPAMNVLVRQVAEAIEQRLLEQSTAQERALLDAYLRTADLPDLLSAQEADSLLRDLPLRDRLVLEERAAELIAYGQRAAVEVSLSHGRNVILRSLPGPEPTGMVGVVAQVRIQDGRWEPLAGDPVTSACDRLGRSAAPPATVVHTWNAVSGDPVVNDSAAGGGDLTSIGNVPCPPMNVEAVRVPRIAQPPTGHALETGTGPAPAAEVPGAPGARDVETGPDGNSTDPWLFLFGEPEVGRLATAARKRLRLLCEAAMSIGQTLDVVRTAEELVEVTVSRFADLVTVDLSEGIVCGEESAALTGGLRRVAVQSAQENVSPVAAGEPVHYLAFSPQARCLERGETVLWPDPGGARPVQVTGEPISLVIAVPLLAQDRVLGVVTFTRWQASDPFEDDDVSLAEELVSRAAVCIDNARRYTHERAISLELERATASLQRSLELQRRFTTDASHELRTPLAGLRAQLEEARLHPDQTHLGELIGHALRDVNRLQAILDDLMLLARLGAVPPTAFERIDLAELAEAEACSRIGDRHEVRLDVRPGVMVDVVPSQICRILRNLLDNAQRHAAHIIVVRVRRIVGGAELSVTDDGPGVPEAECDHIFQRFTRLDTARSRDHGGTGLGLAIARDIAQAHHGTLQVQNASPHGARFVLHLPLI